MDGNNRGADARNAGATDGGDGDRATGTAGTTGASGTANATISGASNDAERDWNESAALTIGGSCVVYISLMQKNRRREKTEQGGNWQTFLCISFAVYKVGHDPFPIYVHMSSRISL